MGRAVFTDLDGTLLGSDQKLSPANHDVLEELGQHGILRVVITGRSLFSCRRVLNRSFPNTYGSLPSSVPFGGFKGSGWGKEGGRDALMEYSRVKNVLIDLN